MGGIPIKRTKQYSRKKSTHNINTHIHKHTSSANKNFVSITADSSAITQHNQYTSNIKSSLKSTKFFTYIKNNFKSSRINNSFSYRTLQHAYASSILKNSIIKPMSEGNNSDNDDDAFYNINWDELSMVFNMDDNLEYDLIPSDIINDISEQTPDWYINFINSEQSIAERIPSLHPTQDEASRNEPTQEPNVPEANTNEPFDNQPSPANDHLQDEPSNQYLSYKPLIPSSKAQLPSYYKPNTNIQKFHSEFPLPQRFFKKWKNGIPLWSSKKYAKKYKDIVTEPKTSIIKDLLKNKIIQKTSRCSFCSDFFLLEAKDKIRPIFNYSQITKSLKPPKFYLPSLYQVISRTNWAPNLYYCKIDFKQAFFNINLSPKSNYITTFIYNKKYYKFNVLPFGIATAPFVCQMMLNKITEYIRKSTNYVWGHIDDIVLAHPDKNKLQQIVKELLIKLNRAGWEINQKKSILIPTKSLTFLGAIWSNKGIKRNPEISYTLKNVINSMNNNLKLKKIQKIYGYLNYYLSYSKFFSSFLFRFIKEPDKLKPLLFELIKLDYLPFKKEDNRTRKIAFSDATPTQIGGITSSKKSFSIPIQHSNIMIAETVAAIATITLHKAGTKLTLFTDNMATLSFINKGAAKFLLKLPPFQHFKFCMSRYLMDDVYNIKASYICSEENPADILSRTTIN